MRIRMWWMLALLCLLAVFAFRIHAIPATFMREDEEIAFRTTAREVGYTIYYQAEQDVHAPLWFVSFWLWQQVAGSNEYTARVYSILLSMITLALVYQIGRSWFGAPRYGLFAALVLGVNAYAFVYSMEIRPYALVMLVASLNMWVFRRWLTRQTWRWAALYGVTVALLMWVHYFLAFLVAAQVIYLVLFRRLTRRLLLQAAGAAALAFLLWLPWFPVFIHQIIRLKEVESGSGDFRGLGIGSTTELTSLPTVVRLIDVLTNGQPLLYGFALVVGLLLLWRSHNYRLALLWLIGVPAINLTVNLIASVYTQRYLSYVSIGLALVIGAALAAMPTRLRWFSLVVFAAVSLYYLPTQLPFHVPHRAIFNAISTRAEAGDVVYFVRGQVGDKLVRWQIDHYLSPELRHNMTSNQDEAAVAGRVWFVSAHFFEPDVQGIFKALEATHPLADVIGNCDIRWCYLAQLLEAPPQTVPTRFGDDMAFWGADIDQTSSTRIDARLWWRVDQAPDADYSIGVHLLDGQGALVAQADGPIDNYGQSVQTSQLQPGRIYVDTRVITPPAPLPPGDYRLVLVVYQSWDNVRLTLPDGSDTLELGTLDIS
jgi:hypothetical protein